LPDIVTLAALLIGPVIIGWSRARAGWAAVTAVASSAQVATLARSYARFQSGQHDTK
jgi:hypothetical protein